MKKIELWDAFNGQKISSHLTAVAAVKAQRKHLAAVQRHNGSGSYLTYAFRHTDGSAVDPKKIVDAKLIVDGEDLQDLR